MRNECSLPYSTLIKGRYKLLKIPFGLKISEDIFQKKIEKINIKNCKVAVTIADDIKVYRNNNMHDLHLHEAMERIRRVGIKLNYDMHSSPNCIASLVMCTTQKV